MNTPAELGLIAKAWGWLQRIWRYGKRIADLESRVTAIEESLKTQPPDACPYCGEHAMRLKEQKESIWGSSGNQWYEETWTCEKCGKDYDKRKRV
jgi:uncharacterized protein with PIN domain